MRDVGPDALHNREAPEPDKPRCPVCRSDQVSTTSKTVTDSTYWRCQGCGEIWNQSRLPSYGRRR